MFRILIFNWKNNLKVHLWINTTVLVQNTVRTPTHLRHRVSEFIYMKHTLIFFASSQTKWDNCELLVRVLSSLLATVLCILYFIRYLFGWHLYLTKVTHSNSHITWTKTLDTQQPLRCLHYIIRFCPYTSLLFISQHYSHEPNSQWLPTDHINGLYFCVYLVH